MDNDQPLIELCTDFVLSRQELQTLLQAGKVQAGGVRNQHDFEEGKAPARADVSDGLDDLQKAQYRFRGLLACAWASERFDDCRQFFADGCAARRIV